MATVKDSIPHIVRTAHEPRQTGVWNATLSRIEQVNSNIRLLRLGLGKDEPPLRHLPGQYVDLYIPNISNVGGFTITSPPQTSLPSQNEQPYIELAIQKSQNNPPAAYLWQPSSTILQSPMSFRIGGNFAYPPLTFTRGECEGIKRVVFVAGGVGVNPIMSMLSAMDIIGKGRLGGMVSDVRVLYSARRISTENNTGEEILFEKRLRSLAERWSGKDGVNYKHTFFETNGTQKSEEKDVMANNIKMEYRRITHEDLFEALGPVKERANAVVYICGLPAMTDEFVDVLKKAEGMDEKRVLCEKWW